MTKPIPDGFNTITPHIVVQDATKAIELYKNAFGAQEQTRHMTPDGKAVMHAQLKVGNSMLMLGNEFRDADGNPDGMTAAAAQQEAARRGLLLLTCGAWGQVVRFIPALVVQSEHINEAASIWLDSVAAVTG